VDEHRKKAIILIKEAKTEKKSQPSEEEERNPILQTIANNFDVIKNDPFGSKIYSKLSKSYSIILGDSDSLQNSILSPLISDSSNTNSTRQSSLRNDNNYRNNNENNRQNQRKQQHYNRNSGDKRTNNFGGDTNKPRRYSNTNQSNNMQKGPYRQQQPHPQQGPMMYPPMRQDMMPNPNYGPAMVQPGYYMPQPQMYNQYYSYPAPQQGMYYPKIY